MDRTVSFQEVLRRLAIIDESFAEDQAGLRLDLPGSQLLDPKAAALVQMGALVAIGAPGVCLEWGTTRARRRGDQAVQGVAHHPRAPDRGRRRADRRRVHGDQRADTPELTQPATSVSHVSAGAAGSFSGHSSS
jgi:hypothetical protein